MVKQVNIPKSSDADKRVNFLIGVIGTNGTGKTSIARKLAIAWKGSRPGQDIIAFDPSEDFEDVADYIIDISDKDWAKRCQDKPNSLLILDDYRILCRESKSSPDFDTLLYRRRKLNIDIIYICHSPALVLNICTYLTNQYYIFHTLATDGSFQKKIPHYHLCVTATRMVNDYVQKHGRGEHPQSSAYVGQDFPYIIVDTQTQELKAINFKAEKLNKK